ncbi:MAG: response regulator [Eubacteriales bacterium]|nr:response regulator [Eubacteriales bacterium]
MKRIKILVVEDDRDCCLLIEHTLKSHTDLEIVGFCGTGEEAVRAAETERPDLVLMDLNLTGQELDGIEAARKIRLGTDARIVILTAYEEPETVLHASVRALASGYVVKSQFAMLVPTIRQTAEGPTPQSHMICAAILRTLSPAEQSVFRQMMGQEAHIRSARKTIANQQTSVLKKLDLTGRKELIHVFSIYNS